MSRYSQSSLLLVNCSLCAFASAVIREGLDGLPQTLLSDPRIQLEKFDIQTTATGYYDDLDDGFVEQLLQDLFVICTSQLYNERNYFIDDYDYTCTYPHKGDVSLAYEHVTVSTHIANGVYLGDVFAAINNYIIHVDRILSVADSPRGATGLPDTRPLEDVVWRREERYELHALGHDASSGSQDPLFSLTIQGEPWGEDYSSLDWETENQKLLL
ncbi:MAG: hypothetical protein M1831_001990 [Alyxoria varia]|nr:MAG: hypothetical protein M1831_001990 [Alyxoria varia]